MGSLFDIARPLLLAFDPERAHEMTLRALEQGLYPRAEGPDDGRLGVKAWGLSFPNPIGIAAGFDKDARVPDAVLGMGFGFAEIGTVTPLAQAGNPKPRLFRLIAERAVINRLGFNNEGHGAALARLRARAKRGVLGVNVGANKDSPDRIGDYVNGITVFNTLADYFTVNISSPNTPGLRDLQAPKALAELLARVMAERRRLAAEGAPSRPVVVKLAPDIADEDLPAILDVLQSEGADGIAVSNTTLSRTGLRDPGAGREAGGLSGRPLHVRSTRLLARVFQLTGGRIPLIGIGGIDSGEAALAKVEAGATLIQLYTGLVYEGPGLLSRIKAHLLATLDRQALPSLDSLRGRNAEAWARRSAD